MCFEFDADAARDDMDRELELKCLPHKALWDFFDPREVAEMAAHLFAKPDQDTWDLGEQLTRFCRPAEIAEMAIMAAQRDLLTGWWDDRMDDCIVDRMKDSWESSRDAYYERSLEA